MTKSQLNDSVEQKLSQLFSSPDLYNSVRANALDSCKKYCEENGKSNSFTLQTDFMDEYVFQEAVSLAMKETIAILCDNHLLSLED